MNATSEPWIIEDESNDRAQVYWIWTSDHRHIVVGIVCDTNDALWHNTRDHARLIAAAPELYEACKAVDDALAKGELIWKHKRQADSDPYHEATVKLIAAIAKAEGGA